tara:strand:- start:734 stop:1774 length:1041 start_codon:yes stop_codon:yes gene_type:complete
MNHHIEAWHKVQSEIFGSKILEIARKIPWGFKEDMPSIKNITVKDFLINDNNFYDTIILHILAGEGEPLNNIIDVINKSYNQCVKLIILEHDPHSEDWWHEKNVTHDRINLVLNSIQALEPFCKFDSWGRNCLISSTTLHPLWLDLSTSYYDKHINKTYLTKVDKGCDIDHLIYTHSSESAISDKIIEKINNNLTSECWWILGGGLCLEAIPSINKKHIIFDSTLRQVLFFRYLLEKDSEIIDKKISTLYPCKHFKHAIEESLPYMSQNNNPKHWRNIYKNFQLDINNISAIYHKDITEINIKNENIYVSTVDKIHWKHLIECNNVIDSVSEPRDIPKYIEKKSRI